MKEYESYDQICQYCGKRGKTRVKQRNGPLVWLWVAYCVLTGICFIVPLVLCWLPCCVASIKSCDHHCPHCERLVAMRIQ